MSRNWLNRLSRWKRESASHRVRLAYRVCAVFGVCAVALGFGWVDTTLISPVNAQDVTYFRIATGGPGSQSFEIAGDISKAISNPARTTDCDASDNCGVPGVIGMAQTTSGAVESLKMLKTGEADGAIIQANMAALALDGKGPFKSAGPDPDLRTIATVGDITLQVIVPAKSDIEGFSDLKGRRIALSATEADSASSLNQIFGLLGVLDKKTKIVPLALAEATNQLIDGKVDALAVFDRRNIPAIMAISDHLTVRLISVTPADMAKVGKDRRDFVLAHLTAGVDGSDRPADTLIVPILFVVPARTDEAVAFDLARTLVVPKPGTRTTANPAASAPDAHIESSVLPLHPGVRRLLQTTN